MPVSVRVARPWHRRVVLLLAASAVAPLVGSAAAPAAPAGPIATITVGPINGSVSASASATFTSSSVAGATFRCALDDRTTRPCAASVTYTNLTTGGHVFRVSARVGNGPFGPEATRTWEVDRRAPTVTIAFPTATRPYTAATWEAGCANHGGACGSAGDTHGVARVTVAVRNNDTGTWFGGLVFTATTAVWLVAVGTDDWHLAVPLPPDGNYTTFARATDSVANETAETSATRRSFSVDTTPPAPPVFTLTPDDPSTSTMARFRAAQAPGAADPSEVRVRCTLDAGTSRNCRETITYSRLGFGQHCVSAVALDAISNTSARTEFCWDVIVDHGFALAGDVVGELAPDVERRVDIAVTNPFAFPLRLLTLDTTIKAATTQVGDPATPNPRCDGLTNFAVGQQLDTASLPAIVIPAGTTRTLSALGIARDRWPRVLMKNLSTNQDACQRTRITLGFSGTATKNRTPEEGR